jgi:multisubunit Na+/H+ antiporter MnhG subunit
VIAGFSVNDVVVGALLAIGVSGFAITSLGLLLSADVFDQIHFLAPGSLIGAVAIPAAVLIHDGFTQEGVKAVLIAILLCCSNPVLSHATARAGRIRRKRSLAPESGEAAQIAAHRKELEKEMRR